MVVTKFQPTAISTEMSTLRKVGTARWMVGSSCRNHSKSQSNSDRQLDASMPVKGFGEGDPGRRAYGRRCDDSGGACQGVLPKYFGEVGHDPQVIASGDLRSNCEPSTVPCRSARVAAARARQIRSKTAFR